MLNMKALPCELNLLNMKCTMWIKYGKYESTTMWMKYVKWAKSLERVESLPLSCS